MNTANQAVFLSYASQDAEAARRIADALRATGVEVWFDQSELRGGDAWDAKIKRQIKECALFVPVISANTQARLEGYFRLEWHLAEQRTFLMAHDAPFLFPVVVDDTPDAAARVPERFRERQWTRITGGQTPEALVQRIVAVLAGETEPAGVAAPSSHHAHAVARSPAGAPATRQREPVPAWVVAAGVLAVAIGLVFVVRPSALFRHAPSATAAPSEAEALVAKARHLIEEEDPSLRENLALAEDLLSRAEKLDEFDGKVWAAHAQLSGVMLDWAIDRSDERRAAMRRQADRAVKLDPDGIESQLAKGWFLSGQRGSASEAIPLLQKLIERAPDDGRPLLLMGYAAWRLDHNDDAIRWFEKSAAFPRTAADAKFTLSRLLFYQGKEEEAEKALDEAIAIRPLALALAAKLRAQVLYHGDLDGAVETLRRIPSSLLLDERGAFNAYRVWLWRREPDKALQVLRDLTLDFIDDANYKGPKAVLVAATEELAGQAELAKGDWGFALRQVEEKRKTAPNDAALLYHRALCLAELGRTAEADQALRELRQAADTWGFDRWPGGGVPGILLKLGHTAEALDELENRLGQPRDFKSPEWLLSLRPVLSLSPDFGPLRDEPRFKALLQRASAAAPNSAPDSSSAPSAPAAVANDKSVAVLAFANLSDDKDNEYFSDGISEELLDVLAKIPGLKVTARTSAFFFKGKEVPIADIARQLGVAYVVEGSVRKQGDRVRISAQLIKASDGFSVWSDSFDRELKDIFALQDEIAGLVAQQLQLKLGVVQAAKVVDPEAYRLLQEARFFWNQRGLDNFDRAADRLQRALAIDPDFAPAHALMADVWVLRADYGLFVEGKDDVSVELAELRKSVTRALELNPSLVEPHYAMAKGLMIERKFEEAGQWFEKAFALSPPNATRPHWYGEYFLMQGQFLAGWEQLKKTSAGDPLSFIVAYVSTTAAFNMENWEEVLRQAERAESLRTGSFGATDSLRAFALSKLGRQAEAVELARAFRRSGTGQMRGMDDAVAVAVLRAAGLEQEASEYAEMLLKERPPHHYARGFLLAEMGRLDEAIPYLERIPAIILPYLAGPALAAHRDDPRFTQLLETLHWTEACQKARADIALVEAGAAR